MSEPGKLCNKEDTAPKSCPFNVLVGYRFYSHVSRRKLTGSGLLIVDAKSVTGGIPVASLAQKIGEGRDQHDEHGDDCEEG